MRNHHDPMGRPLGLPAGSVPPGHTLGVGPYLTAEVIATGPDVGFGGARLVIAEIDDRIREWLWDRGSEVAVGIAWDDVLFDDVDTYEWLWLENFSHAVPRAGAVREILDACAGMDPAEDKYFSIMGQGRFVYRAHDGGFECDMAAADNEQGDGAPDAA